MKKTLIVLVLLTFAAVPVSAQTYLTNTTLTAAVPLAPSVPVQTITVASATNFEVGGAVFIDHELMDIISVSGTRIGVSRTSRPSAHNTSAVVYVATRAQKALVFVNNASFRSLNGACTRGTGRAALYPIFDVEVTGDYAFCEYEAAAQPGMVWRTNNVQGLNGTGSLRTAWP